MYLRSPSTGLSAEQGAEYAILPGDPARTEIVAQFLDNPKKLAQSREFTSWEGYLDGERILVVSTGIGGPSMAMCVEELYQIGVRNFVRLGTCGGMQKKTIGGDLIIPTGAIRQEGTTAQYVPIEFPSLPDFDFTEALRAAAKKSGCRYHSGVIQSKDSFFGALEPERMPVGYELTQKFDAWIKAGALASEVECAALFTVAGVLRAKAAAVLLCIWNLEKAKAGIDKPINKDFTNAVKIILEAICNLRAY
jgi:uridine phosphorylase